MKEKVIIYGAGGHAKAVIDIIEKEARYQIAGLVDDGKPAQTKVFGYPVLGNQHILAEIFQSGITQAFVAIGDNLTRRNKTQLLASIGFELISAVHPFTSIGREAHLGKGTCVFHGVVIDPCVRVGDGVIVNKKALLGHDSHVHDFVHVAPGVNCGAEVTIGENSFIGIGATIIPGISIGANAIVGAASVVVRNIPPAVTVVGIPARVVKSRI